MENGRFATALGKLPSLEELAASLGVDYDASIAHAADYDIMVTMECFKIGFQRGYFNPPIKGGQF
jgi:DNA polymerase-3 subunit epsilon